MNSGGQNYFRLAHGGHGSPETRREEQNDDFPQVEMVNNISEIIVKTESEPEGLEIGDISTTSQKSSPSRHIMNSQNSLRDIH